MTEIECDDLARRFLDLQAAALGCINGDPDDWEVGEIILDLEHLRGAMPWKLSEINGLVGRVCERIEAVSLAN